MPQREIKPANTLILDFWRLELGGNKFLFFKPPSQRYLQWSPSRQLLLLLYVQLLNVYDSLRPQGLQHTRLPCPSPSPGVCSNSCLLSRWCHPTISSCHPFLLPSIFPSIRVFSNEMALCIRWPKSWSFSISPSNEYSVLISFRIDWSDLLAEKDPQESFPAPQSGHASCSFNIIMLLITRLL